jgi:iron complex transport system ATP-binding protein
MNEKKFLEFVDVNFTYPPVEEYDENGEVFVQESKPVFEHFSAELPEGFVSLVGPNASGKSTLMMLASGRLCPTSGMIKLFETDTREFFPAIKITKTEEGETQEIVEPSKSEEEKNILASVIYQNMEFETSEKVEELLKQVFENGEFQGKSPAQFGNENIFEKVIEVFELKEILNRSISGISKGELQRTLLGFSVLYGSKSIFMDEPLFAMEYYQKEKALSFLVDYSKKMDVSIYISMHEIELSKKFAPLVLLFYPDRNMDLGTPEEVLTDEALEKAYGVPASQLRNTERLTRSQMLEATRVEKEMQEKLNEVLDK